MRARSGKAYHRKFLTAISRFPVLLRISSEASASHRVSSMSSIVIKKKISEKKKARKKGENEKDYVIVGEPF